MIYCQSYRFDSYRLALLRVVHHGVLNIMNDNSVYISICDIVETDHCSLSKHIFAYHLASPRIIHRGIDHLTYRYTV